MSPAFMAAKSRCAKRCPHCARAAHRRQLLLLVIYRVCTILSAACCIVSFPVEGLPGAAFGLAAGAFAIPVIVIHRRSKRGGAR